MNKKFGLILGIVAGVLLVGGGVAYASDSAVPGDFLYPVDLAVESVQRTLTTDPVAEAELETDILAERVAELEEVSEDGNLEDVETAADNVAEQSDEVKTRAREMEETCDAENCDEGEKTRVTTRIEEQSQENQQTMEQVKTKVETKYGEEECSGTCGKIDDATESVVIEGLTEDPDDSNSNGGNGNK
jgi:hypothetical protein